VKNHECGQVTSHCRKAQPYRADLSLFLDVAVVTVKSEITVWGRLFQTVGEAWQKARLEKFRTYVSTLTWAYMSINLWLMMMMMTAFVAWKLFTAALSCVCLKGCFPTINIDHRWTTTDGDWPVYFPGPRSTGHFTGPFSRRPPTASCRHERTLTSLPGHVTSSRRRRPSCRVNTCPISCCRQPQVQVNTRVM